MWRLLHKDKMQEYKIWLKADLLCHVLMQESTLDLFSCTSSITPVSLHIPLHRTLSAILAKLVLLPWKDTKDGFLSSLSLGYSEQEVCSKYSIATRTM